MSIKIGPYTVDILDTGSFGLDGGAMFGVVPKPLWEKAYTNADERNRIPMVARCLLIRGGGKCIVVDTGNARHMSQKLHDIYALDFSFSSLDASLRRFDVEPADVTHVLLTHLHFDHAGGTVIPSGDGFTPRFANARHIVQAEHLAYSERPSEKDRASFLPETWRTIQDHGLFDCSEGDGEILPGIFVRRLYGHTTAMQGIRITDGISTVFFGADLMPTGAHIPVPYVMGYDNEPLRTIGEKKLMLPRAVDEKWIVVFEHDALRQASSIVHTDKGFGMGDVVEVTQQLPL